MSRKTFFLTSIGSIALYAVPMAVRFLANAAVIPVYTRLLTPADYGVLELLDLTSFVIAALIGSNFGAAVFYFYADAPDAAARGRAISTAYLGSFVFAAVGVAAGVLVAGPLSAMVFASSFYRPHLVLVLNTLAFSFPAEVGLCVLRALDRPRAYMFLSVSRILFGVALTLVLLIGFDAGLMSLLWSALAVTIATAAASGAICLPYLRHGLSPLLFLQQLRYSWPLSIGALATLILSFGDRYVLRSHVTLAEIGLYGLACKFGMMVSLVSLAFNHYWRPKMFSVVAQPGGQALYARVFTYYVLLLTAISVALTMLLPLIRLAVGPGFSGALVFIPWLALLYLVRGVSDFFRNAFYLEKATAREAQLSWLGALVCLSGYFLLIPPLKLWGAVAATAISVLFLLGAAYWLAQRLRSFAFELRRALLAAGLGLGLILLRLLLEPETLVAQLGLGCALAVVFPAALWWGGWLEPEEKQPLRESLSRWCSSPK